MFSFLCHYLFCWGTLYAEDEKTKKWYTPEQWAWFEFQEQESKSQQPKKFTVVAPPPPKVPKESLLHAFSAFPPPVKDASQGVESVSSLQGVWYEPGSASGSG